MRKKILLLPFLGLFLGCSIFTSDENGQKKYNPQKFTDVPADAPLVISLDVDRTNQSGENVINLQLKVQNETSHNVSLTTIGAADANNYYEFIITKQDCTVVWNRLKSETLFAREVPLLLKPNETVTFEHNWKIINNQGDKIKTGTYLLFGGLFGVDEYEDATRTGDIIRSYGNVGVGKNPLMITIE